MKEIKMNMRPTIFSKMFNISFHPLKLIRKHKKGFSITLAILFFSGMIHPQQLFALTGGPSAPESSAPSKITSGKMVDHFTGNLDYSIPVMKIGDYPLSLSYNADISMDQEASWVGLGWSLNPGSISRSVRGLPDDFKGADKVAKDFNTKPNIKAGLRAGINLEAFGIDAGSALKATANVGGRMGIYYDNYQGLGMDYSLAPSVSVSEKNKGSLTASLGMNAGSHKEGISLSPSLSLSQQLLSQSSLSVSSTINSLSGIQNLNIGLSGPNNRQVYGINFNSFSDRSYNPKIQFPMTSTQGTFSLSVGGEAFGIYGSGSLTGYYSQQHLKTRHKDVPAYGYFYTEKADNDPDALLDYKREKDGAFTSQKPNLPIPNYTHDIFNVSGPNLSGSFRAHRGDVGVVYDHRVKSLGGDKAVPGVGGFNISGEVGGGNLAKIGVDLKTSNSENTSGIWETNNDILNKISAVKKSQVNEKDYEPFYFKMSGEKQAINNSAFYSKILNKNPAAVKLGTAVRAKAHKVLEGGDGGPKELESKVYKTEREKRIRTISYLTASEAARMGLNRQIKDYPLNNTPLDPSTVGEVNRLSGERKKHHLSQINISKEGMRYIYGVPAYNNTKKEVTFNVSDDKQADCSDGQISYNAGKDNSTDNKAGLNNYFSATTTPGYAYSYLLSSVVSENYVDISGDGPTPDDIGNYTRFNYSRVHKNYKWRTPFKQNKATYQENKHSLDNDNMASYVYGSKEIWYINSIETRNYVAKFIVTDREDGLGVKGENGGKDPAQAQKKLSRIELYTRAELDRNGSNATPLKTAHFEYDYTLCPGIPNRKGNTNSNNGKLTLKKVYYTYGDSEKGRFSPYNFTYHNGQNNPPYNIKSSNRFGFYKENQCQTGKLTNTEFPYVDQDISKTGQFVKAWKLKEIRVPSGGTIRIHYEPDDYAYVQDKKAMQMLSIAGFSNIPNPGALKNELYERNPSYIVNNYLFFDLQQPVQSKSELKNYFPDDEHLFFKAKLDVIGSGKNDPDDHYEYISGFVKHNDFGLYQKSKNGSEYTKAWVKLEKQEIGDYILKFNARKAHPMAKRAWIYSKNHIPKHAFNRSDASSSGPAQIKEALTSIADFVTALTSLHSRLIKRDFARKAKLNKSFIRLNQPNGRKLGGGHRVSKIVMNDKWSEMTHSGKPATYGKVYDYSIVEGSKKISSGVIPFEPRMGEEENPFYQPLFYKHNGDSRYMVKPFGSSFFPGPNVGYSRVEIRNLPRPNANPAPAGYKVKEFYTARDFPVITERTNLKDKSHKPSPLASLNPLKFKYIEKRTVSQGFKIELNDMHGKPKADYTFAHNTNQPLNGKEYFYRTDDQGKLDNNVKVLKPDKTIHETEMGIDIDFVIDSREQKSVTEMKGVYLNFDGFLASIFPIVIPDPLPSYKKETVIFRSIVGTKVIRKRGILDKVVAYKNGAKKESQNLVFDTETGNSLVTRTKNKFDKHTYETKIPAHHIYESMEPGYQNIMASFEKVKVSGGEISNTSINNLLTSGDKLYWMQSDVHSYYNKAWVLESNTNRSVLIDMEGNLLGDGTYDFKVIRSGYDSKSGAMAGTIVSMENPVNGNQLDLNQDLKVLSASAKEYKDDWQTYAGFSVRHEPGDCNCHKKLQGGGDTTDFIGPAYVPKKSKLEYVLALIHYHQDGEIVNNKQLVHDLEKNTGDTGSFATIEKDYVANRLFVNFKLNGKGEGDCNFVFWNQDGLNFPKNGRFKNIRYHKKDESVCKDVHQFFADYIYSYQDTTYRIPEENEGMQVTTKHDTITVLGYSECFPAAECEKDPLQVYYTCELKPGNTVNPYVAGIKGNWRSYKQYDYHAERVTGRIDRTGYYKSFSPFAWSGSPANDWVWKNEVTKIDPFGRQLEQKDPLGNYTANIYGYNYTNVISQVSNARHNTSAFDNFEEYSYYDHVESFGNCEAERHVEFQVPENTSISNRGPDQFVSSSHSHTGEYSAQVLSIAPLEMTRKLNRFSYRGSQQQSKTYELQPDDYVGIFAPQAGRYFVSSWVKDIAASNDFDQLTYDNPKIEILADGNLLTTIRPSGQIIDGWQQINGAVDIPSASKEVTVRLATDKGFAYFDDFRMHPYDGQMQAYVYNPFNLRHKATLNADNYASFFQYSEEGEFTGTKKETSRGIISVKESRMGSFKSDK